MRLRLNRLASLLIVVTLVGPTAAQDISVLYQTQAIVTGQSEESRKPGFAECLRDVLLKVSGDQRLLTRPEVEALLPEAGMFVSSFRYRDRLEGIPIHDEQGTYDRPHDLTCVFDRPRIDGLLASLGSKPWLSPRPRLAVFLAVENIRGDRFMLAEDGKEMPYMVESLHAAAEPLAMQIVVPRRNTLAAAGLNAGAIQTAESDHLTTATKESGGDLPLLGSLVWSDEDLGWVADWRLDTDGKMHAWQVRGVSFDEAFRVAIRGALQVLSGNGTPK